MNSVFKSALAALAVVLSGCATPPQTPIQIDQNSLSSKSDRLGVAMTALPKVDTHFPGAGCLLCVMAASASNSTLTNHVRTLPYEDLAKLKEYVADRLRKKGANVTVIAENLNIESLSDSSSKVPNAARKDYTPLQKKYNVDKLLVIDVKVLGVWRTYSAYFATSEPKGVLQGTGYIVNLKNNVYEWYQPVEVLKSADGQWDEPPTFPGITNAYFQALETGKDSLLKPFAN